MADGSSNELLIAALTWRRQTEGGRSVTSSREGPDPLIHGGDQRDLNALSLRVAECAVWSYWPPLGGNRRQDPVECVGFVLDDACKGDARIR